MVCFLVLGCSMGRRPLDSQPTMLYEHDLYQSRGPDNPAKYKRCHQVERMIMQWQARDAKHSLSHIGVLSLTTEFSTASRSRDPISSCSPYRFIFLWFLASGKRLHSDSSLGRVNVSGSVVEAYTSNQVFSRILCFELSRFEFRGRSWCSRSDVLRGRSRCYGSKLFCGGPKPMLRVWALHTLLTVGSFFSVADPSEPVLLFFLCRRSELHLWLHEVLLADFFPWKNRCPHGSQRGTLRGM